LITDIYGFDKNEINLVEWNMGDSKLEKNNLLEIEQKYDTPGTYVIIQKIQLNN